MEEEQKKNTAAGKYFLDYYQGLRSPVTAKYCSSIFLFFFFFFIIMRETGQACRTWWSAFVDWTKAWLPPASVHARAGGRGARVQV